MWREISRRLFTGQTAGDEYVPILVHGDAPPPPLYLASGGGADVEHVPMLVQGEA